MSPLSRLLGITWLLLAPLGMVLQEPPVEPEPTIVVTATEQVDLGDPIRIKVVTEGKGLLVRVRQVLPGEDLDVSANLLELRAPGEFGFSNRSPGGYLIEAQAVVGESIATAYTYSRIGPMVPPGPGPGPDPDPDPDPNPEPTPGPKWILIVHETADTTPEIARLIVNLRTGDNAKYITENKHRLWILDDDLDPKWAQAVGTTKLPAIVIADPQRGANGAFVAELPKTSADVMKLIRDHD